VIFPSWNGLHRCSQGSSRKISFYISFYYYTSPDVEMFNFIDYKS